MRDAWVIWSYEHDSWWAPNSAGYRTSLLLAGVYTEAEAKKIEASANTHVDRKRYPEGHEKAMILADAIAWITADWPTQGTVIERLTDASPAELRALSKVLP